MKPPAFPLLAAALLVLLVVSPGRVALAVPVAEPTAPQASAPVQKLLHEANQRTEANDPQGELKAADQALSTAREAGDRVGEAPAQETRTHALESLHRAAEAVAAWRAAATAWARFGDGPGQVRALLAAARLHSRTAAADAEGLMAQALALGKAEVKRPLAAVLAIHTAGNEFFDQGMVPQPAGSGRQGWPSPPDCLRDRPGKNVAGEGIVGMTRALQYAGARAVVASQWKVADRSTATLMVAFHRKLRQGLAKDEALRQAMAVVRNDPRTAQPYCWVPFCLSGDPDNPYPAGRARPVQRAVLKGGRP
jgi:hypothetical protein